MSEMHFYSQQIYINQLILSFNIMLTAQNQFAYIFLYSGCYPSFMFYVLRDVSYLIVLV